MRPPSQDPRTSSLPKPRQCGCASCQLLHFGRYDGPRVSSPCRTPRKSGPCRASFLPFHRGCHWLDRCGAGHIVSLGTLAPSRSRTLLASCWCAGSTPSRVVHRDRSSSLPMRQRMSTKLLQVSLAWLPSESMRYLIPRARKRKARDDPLSRASPTTCKALRPTTGQSSQKFLKRSGDSSV